MNTSELGTRIVQQIKNVLAAIYDNFPIEMVTGNGAVAIRSAATISATQSRRSR